MLVNNLNCVYYITQVIELRNVNFTTIAILESSRYLCQILKPSFLKYISN